MRILMTGGGTAGHVNPALAIAGIIKNREPDSVVEFIGTENGLEAKLVPSAGYKLNIIKVMGLSRSLSPKNVKALYLAYSSVAKCKRIIESFRPDVVIGTGGYVCWPVIRAARLCGIPSFLHESNLHPGFAVKSLRNTADAVMVNFEGTAKLLEGGKAEICRVGMPVNEGFLNVSHAEARKKLVTDEGYRRMIVSFGGSLGAARLNEAVFTMMNDYGRAHPEILHIHACGARNSAEASEKFAGLGLDRCSNLKLVDYIYNMPEMLAACDLVICRSGASTIAELAATGTPSILIPSPNVTNDQQTKNALLLYKAGAALLLKEDASLGEKLTEAVGAFFADREEAIKMRKAVGAFCVKDCADRIYGCVRNTVDAGHKR